MLMRAHAAAGDMLRAEEVMDHMRDAGASSTTLISRGFVAFALLQGP